MLLTDAVIWASEDTARRTYRRILWAAPGLFVVLFVGGGLAGLFFQ